MARITLSLSDPASYPLFLRIKALPTYRFQGREAIIPDEYARLLGIGDQGKLSEVKYIPASYLFDYQRDISRLAIQKRKFACFMECGFGKTAVAHEFARHALACLPPDRCVLIVSPLMVIRQTMAEAKRFYGDSLPIEQVRAADLATWVTSGESRLGITNYEALHSEIPQGRLGALIADESAYMKSHYGKWGQELLRLGKGLQWKLALTGTPAPNDRIEFANHAVFLDAFPTVNSFLARYFVNRGQTANRWELKPHALKPFYRSLSHWCIFMSRPGTYGWKDNADDLPPIQVHIHDVDLTAEQDAAVREMTGTLFAMNPGGITTRSKLARIAKGHHDGQEIKTCKPEFIRSLIASWPDESTIIWARYNAEQDALARFFPDAGNIDGSTPHEKRVELIEDFQQGRRKVLISKPKILGLGLNLQIATRQVFSSCQDSWEEFHQAVKRSNRVGSTRPLNVHLPITEIERPMLETVLRKAHRIEMDTLEQEEIFRGCAL